MKDCLSEEQLVAAFYGDAGETELNHLSTCLECSRRMRRLRSDLERIGGALSDAHAKRGELDEREGVSPRPGSGVSRTAARGARDGQAAAAAPVRNGSGRLRANGGRRAASMASILRPRGLLGSAAARRRSAGVALAAAAVLAVVTWLPRESGRSDRPRAATSDWLASVETLSAAVFDDAAGETAVTNADAAFCVALAATGDRATGGDLVYVSSALGGALPCSWNDPLDAYDCSAGSLFGLGSND